MYLNYKKSLAFILLFVVVFNQAFSQNDENVTNEKLKVYFSAKISKPDYCEKNLTFCNNFFTNNYRVFLPQQLQIPVLERQLVEVIAYKADKKAIEWADIIFLLSPYGKDCSWEIGYAKGKNKIIIGFLSDKDSVNDSMVMGSLSLILTDDADIMKTLEADERTKKKCLFIKKENFNNFADALYDILLLKKEHLNNFTNSIYSILLKFRLVMN